MHYFGNCPLILIPCPPGIPARQWVARLSVSTPFDESRWVSVSTSSKFFSLDESRSQHPPNFLVSMSLGLDIQHIFQSRWVSVSTSTNYQSLLGSGSISQKKNQTQRESRWSLGIDIFCAVSSLRLRLFQSQSWSSLRLRFFSLGLVIET